MSAEPKAADGVSTICPQCKSVLRSRRKMILDNGGPFRCNNAWHTEAPKPSAEQAAPEKTACMCWAGKHCPMHPKPDQAPVDGGRAEVIPHRVKWALQRIMDRLGGTDADKQAVQNELMDVWDHHSILPTAPIPVSPDPNARSMTYGEVGKAAPATAHLIEPHEWDNKNISEQRDWAVAALEKQFQDYLTSDIKQALAALPDPRVEELEVLHRRIETLIGVTCKRCERGDKLFVEPSTGFYTHTLGGNHCDAHKLHSLLDTKVGRDARAELDRLKKKG